VQSYEVTLFHLWSQKAVGVNSKRRIAQVVLKDFRRTGRPKRDCFDCLLPSFNVRGYTIMKKQIIAVAVMALAGSAAFAQDTASSATAGGVFSFSASSGLNTGSVSVIGANATNQASAIGGASSAPNSAAGASSVLVTGQTQTGGLTVGTGLGGAAAAQEGSANSLHAAPTGPGATGMVVVNSAAQVGTTSSSTHSSGPGAVSGSASASDATASNVTGAFVFASPSLSISGGATVGDGSANTSGGGVGTFTNTANGTMPGGVASLNSGGWVSFATAP
jgi:hypothetical protein